MHTPVVNPRRLIAFALAAEVVAAAIALADPAWPDKSSLLAGHPGVQRSHHAPAAADPQMLP